MTGDEMIQALADIRDQLVRDQYAAERRPAPKLQAFAVMRRVVKDSVAGALEGHKALEHRETGCCDTFTVEDVMQMIDDAEREIKGRAKP